MKTFNIIEQQASLESLQSALPEIFSNEKNKNYFATKQFETWNEVFESSEFKNIFGDSYRNHLEPTKARYSKYELLSGYIVNNKVYVIYTIANENLQILKEITLGSMIHNGGFHSVLHMNGIVTIVKQNWENSTSNRKEIARLGHTITDTMHL